MSFQQFELKNFKEFGELVKEWSRVPGTPRPTDPQKFYDLLVLRGVEPQFKPSDYKEVVYHDAQGDLDAGIIHIKVPPKTMINKAENDILTQPYPLTPFYLLDMTDPSLQDNTPAGRKTFHSKRVGEYTVRFCG